MLVEIERSAGLPRSSRAAMYAPGELLDAPHPWGHRPYRDFLRGHPVPVLGQERVRCTGLGDGLGATVLDLLGYAVTVFISTAMLTLLYEAIPNTRVKATAGRRHFVSALLWEAGKFGFGKYIAYSAGYAKALRLARPHRSSCFFFSISSLFFRFCKGFSNR